MTESVRDYLGEAVIKALRRPVLDDARGLPAKVYTDQQFLAMENAHLFPSTWTGVAFASDVPQPGDVMPFELCGIPLILLRGEDGQVRVFQNVCRHRATIVVQAPLTAQSMLKCPYHGWVYGLDGALIATPFWDGTADSHRLPVDASCNGLVAVRCDVWNHVVFVNLDGKALPLLEYLAPMQTELEHLAIDELEVGHREEWTFNANWKLVMENWEVYHHVWVHEGVFDRMSDEVDLRTGEPYTDMIADGNALLLRYKASRPQTWARRRPNVPGQPLPPVRQVAPRETPHSTANAVLPNTTVTINDTAFVPAIYLPIAPGKTLARMAWYFAPGAAQDERFRPHIEKVLDRWLGPTRRFEDKGGIRPQDHHCMELQQRARSSPVADDVKFSTTWEANVRYFQDWVLRRLERVEEV
ncbi:MAG: Rieske 2Fe-2S domain-containing protein [Gammaproteobacteria bacterium]|nr:Rieske 2Fe-2S domain-containing protein [Gammaproteobacteria bacterium]